MRRGGAAFVGVRPFDKENESLQFGVLCIFVGGAPEELHYSDFRTTSALTNSHRNRGRSPSRETLAICPITSFPEITLPKIVYLPSSVGWRARQRKKDVSLEPGVSLRAIESVPASCFSLPTSSLRRRLTCSISAGESAGRRVLKSPPWMNDPRTTRCQAVWS